MTDQPLTQQQLDEYEQLLAATIPGPWHLTDADTIVAPLTGETIADVWEPTPGTRNGEFIETARTAMPALLAEVRRLNAALADQVRYAAALEADLCQCDPLCESGEYLHAADCPVVDIQMQLDGDPAADETHVVADDSDDPEHIDDCPGCDAPDTLPAWLYSRFNDRLDAPAWDLLPDEDRAYWAHQAAAVRRAVARGGFKPTAPAVAPTL